MTNKERYNDILNKLISDNMSPEDRYWIERKALDDPMLFDAIEGYARVPSPEHYSRLQELQERISSHRQKRNLRRLVLPISIAASILLMVFIGSLLLKSDPVVPENSTMVMKEADVPPPTLEEDAAILLQDESRDAKEDMANTQPTKSEPRPDISQKTSASSTLTIAEETIPAKEQPDISPIEIPLQDQPDIAEAEKELPETQDLAKQKRVTDPTSGRIAAPARGITLNNLQTENVQTIGAPAMYTDNKLNRFLSEKYNEMYTPLSIGVNIRFDISFDDEYAVRSVNIVEGDTLIGGRLKELIKAYPDFSLTKDQLGKRLQYLYNVTKN